jgi:hypothetical protein
VGLHEFTFDRMLTQEFVDYPYAAYRDDPKWVPPPRRAVLSQLEPSAEFFRRAGNRHRNYLAKVRSRIVGRITASICHDLRDANGAPVGSLGFFEADDDPGVARDLIGAARQWLRGQGARRIWGPVNFDIWHGYRLMTGGFGTQIFAGEPYNKPYYAELFERCGLAAKQRWDSFDIEDSMNRERFRRRGIERRNVLVEQGYRFVAFDMRRLNAQLNKLHALVCRSYAHFAGFTPISASEFRRLALPLRYAVLPGFAAFVHDPQDTPCGFVTMPLDLSDPLRAMHGRSDWLARVRFFRARRGVRRVLLHAAGLVPEEAKKHSGLGAALIAHVADRVLHEGRRPCIAALVAHGSDSRGHLEQYAAIPTRQYALFEATA